MRNYTLYIQEQYHLQYHRSQNHFLVLDAAYKLKFINIIFYQGKITGKWFHTQTSNILERIKKHYNLLDAVIQLSYK